MRWIRTTSPLLKQTWTTSVRLYSAQPLPLPVPPPLARLTTDEDMDAVQIWAAQFKQTAIPKSHVDLTFARSSGPGGQNVNKVNTKAVARCPLHSPWIPAWSKEALRQSPSYVASSDSILVTSDAFRVQTQNVESCLAKLHALVLNTALSSFRRPTSAETLARVNAHIKADKARQRKEKDIRKSVRMGRKDTSWD